MQWWTSVDPAECTSTGSLFAYQPLANAFHPEFDMLAIRADQPGGPEVLKPADFPEPSLTSGRLLVDVHSVGVNFLDIYLRRGIHPRGEPVPMPFVPGDEGVGTVRAVAEDVTGFAPGDRVGWILGEACYAEVVAAPAAYAVKIPPQIEIDKGLVLAQGLTAHYLAHEFGTIGDGTPVLVHAAAGGVGLLLTQILKIRGAFVIAAVSSEAKAQAARAAGADAAVLYLDPDFAPSVRRLSGGKGVSVVFDGVGRDTFHLSLASLGRRGFFVLFGAASGAVESIDPRALQRAGSVSFARPGLRDFIETRAELQSRADDLFRWIGEGRLEVEIGNRYPLAKAADAHRTLESRGTIGKQVLVCSIAS